MSKKKKKKTEADEIQPVVLNRSPGFSAFAIYFDENDRFFILAYQDGRRSSSGFIEHCPPYKK